LEKFGCGDEERGGPGNSERKQEIAGGGIFSSEWGIRERRRIGQAWIMCEATEAGFFVQEQWVRDGESEARRAEAGHYNQKRSAAG
jgi:hypothetical protein